MKTNLARASTTLGRWLEEWMQHANIPGMAVALTDREQVLSVYTCGYADLATRTDVTPDTLFAIGSISKSFLALILLQLQAEGRIDLHAPITSYLPWLAVPEASDPPSIHHLLSHTAGLCSGANFTPSARYGAWVLREVVYACAPGSQYHYSNLGYRVLGFLLEDLLSKPYAQIMQERILTPLGMRKTEPVITHEIRRCLAVGYDYCYDDRPNPIGSPLVPATWVEYGAGDGSIATTVEELAIFLRLLLCKGQGSEVLSEANYNLMTRSHVSVGKGMSYGYGLFSRERDGYRVFGHSGSMLGYHSTLLFDSEYGLGIIVMTNCPQNTLKIAEVVLSLLRAATHSLALPLTPVVWETQNNQLLANHAGTYQCGEKTLVLSQTAAGTSLVYQGEEIPLVLLGSSPDVFYSAHPDFALFPLRLMKREGKIVELIHGSDCYVGEHSPESISFASPRHWQSYIGHYRSYIPWLTNFRVVLRKDRLLLIYPGGEETTLVALADSEDTFRIGEEEHSIEWICFDTIVEGQALRASLSGGDYYRTFTP